LVSYGLETSTKNKNIKSVREADTIILTPGSWLLAVRRPP